MWDGTGLCIFQKRLERGRFASLWRDDGNVVRLTSTELALFVEGCELVGRHRLSPAAVLPAPAGIEVSYRVVQVNCRSTGTNVVACIEAAPGPVMAW